MAPRGPVLARGDELSVRGVHEDEHPGWNEYLPESNEVRYVACSSGVNPVRYDVAPYERLATAKAASLAADHVRKLLIERLDESACGLSVVDEFVDGENQICVMPTTRLSRDGTVISEPSMTVDELVAIAPRTVTATVEWLGREATTTVSVVVKEATAQDC